MPLRILLVTPGYAPDVGGVETHVTRIATSLAADGHQVEVLTQTSNRSLASAETISGVLVRRFRVRVPARGLRVAPGLWHHLSRRPLPVDIVHAHNYHALPALSAALCSTGPLVFTPHYHGTGHTRLTTALHRPYRPAGAFIFSRSQAVICVSRAEAALVQRDFDVTPVAVIPNGVDVEELLKARPFNLDRPVVLTVGRLEAYKNVDLVIDAVQELPPEWLLTIIGDGPERPRLQALVRELGLQSRVQLVGRLSTPDVRRWYRTAAVVLSMSSQEAYGITLAEALAAGAAVVASSIPSHQEIVGGSQYDPASLLPLTAHPKDLANAILGAAARTVSGVVPKNILTWDRVADAVADVYREAINLTSA